MIEQDVQSLIRLEASDKGVRLFRNNVGVLLDKRGVPVRYGLANDTAKLNNQLKSADLIGWRRVIITPDMVGRVIAQFVSRECKPGYWTPAPSPRDGHAPSALFLHEEAQRAWARIVNEDGGDAQFATGVGTL